MIGTNSRNAISLSNSYSLAKINNFSRDILERSPTPQAYEMLGDAYMSIQEPTKAIEAYEAAMRRSPKDFLLAEKIGKAYVSCHLYNKVNHSSPVFVVVDRDSTD